MKRERKKPYNKPNAESPPPLYFFAHPLSWWAQFDDECDVAIKPWDVMGNGEEFILINNTIASLGYRILLVGGKQIS